MIQPRILAKSLNIIEPYHPFSENDGHEQHMSIDEKLECQISHGKSVVLCAIDIWISLSVPILSVGATLKVSLGMAGVLVCCLMLRKHDICCSWLKKCGAHPAMWKADGHIPP